MPQVQDSDQDNRDRGDRSREMIATMVARLLEGAPATATTGRGPPTRWSARCGRDGPAAGHRRRRRCPACRQQWLSVERPYIRGQREFLADFRAKLPPRRRGGCKRPAVQHDRRQRRSKTCCGSPGPRHLAPELWPKAIEELPADGLETTVAPNALFEESSEHGPPSGICLMAPLGRRAAGLPALSLMASTSSATWPSPAPGDVPRCPPRPAAVMPRMTAPWASPVAQRWHRIRPRGRSRMSELDRPRRGRPARWVGPASSAFGSGTIAAPRAGCAIGEIRRGFRYGCCPQGQVSHHGVTGCTPHQKMTHRIRSFSEPQRE